MISRNQSFARVSLWPLGGVPYSQTDYHSPDGYRSDCSGFVLMCWNAGTNYNTESMVTSGLIYEIPFDELKLGDAIGLCGLGTAGDAGHIQYFVKWYNSDPNDNRYYCYEQTGGSSGPHYNLDNLDNEPGYKAYRFRDITDDDSTGGDDSMILWHFQGDGGIYIESGVDAVSKLPILWHVATMNAVAEYARLGYTPRDVAGVPNWSYWKKGEEVNPNGSVQLSTFSGTLSGSLR